MAVNGSTRDRVTVDDAIPGFDPRTYRTGNAGQAMFCDGENRPVSVGGVPK